MKLRRSVFFLDTAKGRRFCLLTAPVTHIKGGLLYVHPFAEELNKSRRMAALAAREFASAGWLVLQMDLLGCGDSERDFGDATWEDWLEDVESGWNWLQNNATGTLALWSLRGGSLLAADWLHNTQRTLPWLMWQPVTSGNQHLTQFLRLKLAAEMGGNAETKTVMAGLRSELQDGRAVEVGGYMLSPAMAKGLGAANLRLPPTYPAALAVLEVVGEGRDGLSPALTGMVGRWQDDKLLVMAKSVVGPAFWQTQEIETSPALLDASLCILEKLLA